MMFDPLFLIPIAIALAGAGCSARRSIRSGEIRAGRTLTAVAVLLISLRGTTPAQRVNILRCLPELLTALGTTPGNPREACRRRENL
ncbi:hypothetical protein SAMN05444920_12920 [Nonomuraea solani]|uniref:Uncharacterized protein n=1 Tax=Nonomuraea solani TaxID=1144553 RepID=A0A1H6EXS1_9ACTN|nr:hypothetical protein [Nonomuraea solani]SEH02688.1 hypothetical protein SAMN05444920_12920 [Nonomuraea solani]